MVDRPSMEEGKAGVSGGGRERADDGGGGEDGWMRRGGTATSEWWRLDGNLTRMGSQSSQLG